MADEYDRVVAEIKAGLGRGMKFGRCLGGGWLIDYFKIAAATLALSSSSGDPQMSDSAVVVFQDNDGRLSPAIIVHDLGPAPYIYGFLRELDHRNLRDCDEVAARFAQNAGEYLDMCGQPDHGVYLANSPATVAELEAALELIAKHEGTGTAALLAMLESFNAGDAPGTVQQPEYVWPLGYTGNFLHGGGLYLILWQGLEDNAAGCLELSVVRRWWASCFLEDLLLEPDPEEVEAGDLRQIYEDPRRLRWLPAAEAIREREEALEDPVYKEIGELFRRARERL
jgi:hypothetical protein